MEVPAKEAQTTAGKSACKQVHFGDAEYGSYNHHTDSCHKGNGRTETVDTVSQVYCVDGADDNKHCKWIVQQTDVQLTEERDLQDGGGCSTKVQNCQIERCDQQLTCHFLFCSQTEVLFFYHFHIVISKAQSAKSSCHENTGNEIQLIQRTGAAAVDVHGDETHHCCNNDAQNKHHAAHGWGALFCFMPSRAILQNGLTEFQFSQERNNEFTGQGCDHKCSHNGNT